MKIIRKNIFFILPLLIILYVTFKNIFITQKSSNIEVKNIVENFHFQTTMSNKMSLELFAKKAFHDKQISIEKIHGKLYNHQLKISFITDFGELNIENKILKIPYKFILKINDTEMIGKNIVFCNSEILTHETIYIKSPNYLLTSQSMLFDMEKMFLKFHKPILKIQKS